MVVVAFGFGLSMGVSERITGLATAQTSVQVFGGGEVAPAGVDFSQLWRVWHILEQDFVQTSASSTLPTDQEKIYGAIQGLTASYGDAYTVFLPPQDAQIFNEGISGSFSGVGMELGIRDNIITVVSPLKGSPAERAGIKSGDQVMLVDTTSTANMAVEQAVKLIRGPKGTTVKLTLKRAGLAEPLVVSIVRETINVPIIKTSSEGGVFTIELYSFSQTSPGLFRNALREFFESGNSKLILDLRGNPGGYLEAAVDMASYFLAVGEPIVTEDYKGNGPNNVHRSIGYNVFVNKKVAVAILVDQGSASASEILAGALQQHGVGKLIGVRTFGKGSVQQLLDLGGGAELKVTIARWLTPNGSSISDGGLTPDLVVERSTADVAAGRDPQRAAATAWLATQ